MIVWLDKELLLAIHDRQLAEHGGTSGVRDETLLESALARAQQLHAYGEPTPDLADLAAALAYGVARNHAFVDGNKRTAHVAYRTFLALNGAEFSATDEEKYLAMIAIAEGKWTAAQFAAWLRPRIRPQTPSEIHEPSQTYRARRRAGAAKPRAARARK